MVKSFSFARLVRESLEGWLQTAVGEILDSHVGLRRHDLQGDCGEETQSPVRPRHRVKHFRLLGSAEKEKKTRNREVKAMIRRAKLKKENCIIFYDSNNYYKNMIICRYSHSDHEVRKRRQPKKATAFNCAIFVSHLQLTTLPSASTSS